MSYSLQESVCGFVMLYSPDALAQALAAGCRGEWFSEPKAALCWRTIADLHVCGFGVQTCAVAAEMEKRGDLANCDLTDLSRMVDSAAPTALSFGDSLRWLAKNYAARKRKALWDEGSSAGKKSDPDTERETNELIAETFAAENPPQTFQQAAAEFDQALERGAPSDLGIRTGLVDVDKFLGTLQPGELTVVAARPGCGKSSLLRQVGVEVALAGRRVVMVSTEMGAKEIVVAAAKQVSGLPWGKDYRLAPEQDEHFRATVRRLSTMSTFRLLEVRQLGKLVAMWRALMGEETPPSMFCVDYLQQLDAGLRKGETLAAAVGRISGELKAFAKEFRVVVLAAAQLNRETARDGDPQLYHLRDSGAIEQDADRVLMLKMDPNASADSGQVLIEMFQRKNRNGALGSVKLTFDRPTTRFRNHAST